MTWIIYSINHSFSIKHAAPIPVPTHIETIAFFAFVLYIYGSNVAICLEPVQPRGCPIAMAPPLGFNFFGLIFNFSTQ